MSQPLLGTASAANAITRVKYSHDAMIDLIVANPGISQNAIAKEFGYSVGWVSRVFCSDAFQARLAARKEEMVDPVIGQCVEERFKALVVQSMDILEEKLATSRSPDLAMKVFDSATRAAGYGARQANVSVQQNFVVHVPNKIERAEAWVEAHRPEQQVVTGSPVEG